METRITQAAKELFIKKGFAETSMSEIADMAGINRPTLHYYFRTKDKMFKAVFGQIVRSILPRVNDVIVHSADPVGVRVGKVADIYYGMLAGNTGLPLFIIREIHRDARFLFDTIRYSPVFDDAQGIARSLQESMDRGEIRRMPLHIVFFTFYGLLTFPILTYPLASRAAGTPVPDLGEIIDEWKPYLVSEMEHLLAVDK